MTRLTIDKSFQAALSGVTEAVELCTPEGVVVGLFTPAAAIPAAERDRLAALFRPEEIELARSQTGGVTTAELLDKLRKLGT